MSTGLAKLWMGAKVIALFVVCLLPFTPNWQAAEKEKDDRGRTIVRYCDSVAPERQQATLELMAAFEKENPDIKVVVEFVPSNNFLATILSRFAAGRAPDVLRISMTNVGTLASKGLFVDLNPYAKRDRLDLSDFYHQALTGFTFNDELIGLPYYCGAVILAYNLDLFDADGVRYPSEDWTWSDMRSAALRLTHDLNGDGHTDQYGIEVTGNNILSPLVFAESSWLDSDRKTWRGDSPRTLEAMQFCYDLITKDHVSPYLFEAREFGFGHLGLLLGGKAAMCGIGPWDLKLLRKSNLRWQVAEFPPRTKGAPRGSRWSGEAYTITVHCRNRDAGWRLVKFMVSDRAQLSVVKLGEGIPARRSIAERYFVSPDTPCHEELFLRAVEYAKFTDEFFRPEFASELSAYVNTMMMGNISPREAMTRFAPMAKLLLKDEKL